MTQPATPTARDRIMRAFRSLVRAEDPNRSYGFGPYEYQVQSATSTTFDGSPTEQNFPLPPLVGVPYRPSIAGATCTPTAGTLAYVAFANADPSKPILICFGPTTPEQVSIDATGNVNLGNATHAVIRESDQILITGVVNVVGGTVSGTVSFFGASIPPQAHSKVIA